MACDYYIITRLKIKYIDDDDEISEDIIDLEKTKCYSYDYYDNDDSSDEDEGYFYNNLKVNKPIILFDNNKWKHNDLYLIYKDLLINYEYLIKVIKEEVIKEIPRESTLNLFKVN